MNNILTNKLITTLTVPMQFIYGKRFMETSTEATPRQRIIREDKEEEIQQDPLPEREPVIEDDIPIPPTENKTISVIRKIYDKLTPENKEKVKENMDDLNNMSTDTFDTSKREPLYIAPEISTEALMVDVAMKSFTANLNELGERTGHEIKKSTELAQEWKTHIAALDTYIKSLQKLPWKKMLTYSACLLTIIGFMWKMGGARAIPDFISNAISFIPTNTSPLQVVDVPKPSIENTIKGVMETPLTPLAIITGVGIMTISLGTLKTILWI